MFNICEAFFSGFYFYREEFSSSLLGYVLSPLSSHGMKTAPLKSFIEKLLTIDGFFTLKNIFGRVFRNKI